MVGNPVMLLTCDLCMSNNRKVAASFIGPFKVLKHVGKLSYCIELPPIHSTLHNVFHVSNLKLYSLGGGDETTNNVQLVLVDSEEQYEVEKIVAKFGLGNHKQYLVHWVDYSAGHNL